VTQAVVIAQRVAPPGVQSGLTSQLRRVRRRVSVMTLTWKDGYTTGVPELDEQHRQIFDLVNGLGRLIERGACDSPEVDALLEGLGEDVQRHFTMEEGCMSRHHCPMAQKNKQEHAQLLRLYLDFLSAFNAEKSLDALAGFHRAAEGWLLEHICFVDIHLRSCVNHVGS
jgi:hemerythrin